MVLSPSLMCANFENLKFEVEQLEKAGADCHHLDVMDGRFVPNFSMGLQDVKTICRLSTIPTELHLMIERPGEYVGLFADAGVDVIYFHPEADYHPTTVIQKIVEMGKIPGIVLNPGTSVESVAELLNIVKKVLIMCVNPGHAGQIYLPYMDEKLNRILDIKGKFNIEIMLDGACSKEKIVEWNRKGIDGFVLGRAALFDKKDNYENIFSDIKKSVIRNGSII